MNNFPVLFDLWTSLAKQLYFLPALFILTSCEQSHKDKIQEAVKNQVEKKNKDYHSLTFGEVDTVMEMWEDSKTFKDFDDKFIKMQADSAGAAIMVRLSTTDEEKKEAQRTLDDVSNKLKQVRSNYNKAKNNFKPQIKAFSIQHTFLAGKDTQRLIFMVDTNYKVKNSIPVKE